jgi:pimeloyl-ACP methyl ester carboxylesterase
VTRQPRHGEHLLGASGARLACAVVGEGERVALLLHGGGQTRHAWDKTALQLARHGWTAVPADQRGHGESERVADGAYAFFDYAADASALARQLIDRFNHPPVAIGASLGGVAALLAADATPDLFAGLVLVDVTPRMRPEGVGRIQGFMRERAQDGFASVEEAAEAVAAYLPHRPRPASNEGLKRNLRRSEDERWRWHWDPRFLDGPRPINQDYQQVYPRACMAAANLKIPTLLVRGQSSELVEEAAAAEFRDLCAHAEYADIAGARHMVAGDRNDAFASVII